MSATSKKKRWVPFQCPLCFGLFRLRRSQIGSAGHCPTCQSIIRVTDDSPSVAETPRVDQHEPDGALLKRLPVAQAMTPDELAAQEGPHRNRKRHHAGGAGPVIDWEQDDKVKVADEEGPSWKMIGGWAIVLALALGGGAFLMKNMTPEEGSENSSATGELAAQAILLELLEQAQKNKHTDEDGVDAAIEIVDQHEKFDVEKIDDVITKFLNSATVSERSQFIREPDRVRPLMLQYYGGEEFEAEGVEALDKLRFTYKKRTMTAIVQTADFLSYPIGVERIGDGEEAVYRVDWESWVGYCELPPDEMRLKKPTDPVVIRAIVSLGSYYNYGFSDDEEWSNYRLAFQDSEFSFLGYAKKNSEVDNAFAEIVKNGKRAPFVLKVRYPPGARSKDQVEIVEVLSADWFLSADPKKDNE